MHSDRSILCVLLPLLASCAGHTAPDSTPASAPGISWELRAGDKRGDERLICESSARPQPCALEATSDKHRMLAILSVQLTAQGRETNYVGRIAVPFIEGSAAASEVSVVVPAGERPVSRTIMGVVTRQTGEYTMTFALDALIVGGGAPIRLYEEVPVTLR